MDFGGVMCGRGCVDSSLMYFAQNGTYLGPVAGSKPSSVTSAVGFNENATLPFEVRDDVAYCMQV